MTTRQVYREALWRLLEDSIGCPIEDLIKNILEAASLDHPAVLKKFKNDGRVDTSAFHEVVIKFVREGSYRYKVGQIEEAERENYFGVFSDRLSEFEFSPGERIKLDSILEHFVGESIPCKDWQRVERLRKPRKRVEPYRAPLGTRRASQAEDGAGGDVEGPGNIFVPAEDEAKILKSLESRQASYCPVLQDALRNVGINVDLDENSREVKAELSCPFCPKRISLKKKSTVCRTKTGVGTWCTYNFDRHYIRHGTRVQPPNKENDSQTQRDPQNDVAESQPDSSAPSNNRRNNSTPLNPPDAMDSQELSDSITSQPDPTQIIMNSTAFDPPNAHSVNDSGFMTQVNYSMDATVNASLSHYRSFIDEPFMPPGPGPSMNYHPSVHYSGPFSPATNYRVTELR